MKHILTTWLALLVALFVTGMAGAEEDTGSDIPDGMVEFKEKHFRIGLNGYAAFDTHGDDGAAMKIGAASSLPHFEALIKYGLGVRLGFVIHYHQCSEGSVKYNGEVAGVDITYFEDFETPESVTTKRTDGFLFSYGMSINFKYEVTVNPTSPAYRFFRWIQPYVGIGAVLSWTRTHTDIPKEMSVLIENEAYRGADPESEYDPWSIQFGPGFNLFGGMHFNVDPKFRLSVEVGYYTVDVPGGEPDGHLKYSTDGHDAHHEPYKWNDFKLGGGIGFIF